MLLLLPLIPALKAVPFRFFSAPIIAKRRVSPDKILDSCVTYRRMFFSDNLITAARGKFETGFYFIHQLFKCNRLGKEPAPASEGFRLRRT